MKQQLLLTKKRKYWRGKLRVTGKKRGTRSYCLWKIPVSFKQQVDCLAQEQHMEPLKFLQEAIDQVTERQEAQKRPSFYDRAKHILEEGGFHGPKTLSSDKKHLKGIGQKRLKKA